MIFPKCMIGRAPQVTYHGYVLPCCWTDYDEQIDYLYGDKKLKKQNKFLREEFNLYNNKIKDILESPEWSEMLQSIFYDTPKKCKRKCGKFFVKNKQIDSHNNEVPKIDPSKTNLNEHMSTISTDETIFWNDVEKFRSQKNRLQLETTTRCTLACPYCTRTKQAGTGAYYKADLSLQIMEDILNYKSWEQIIDCGRYGDSVFYKYFYEMLTILQNSSVERYQLHNAATGRGISWWEKIIDKMIEIQNSGTTIQNIFGIDGLENTSHIHRVNQDWNEITTAMRLSKEAGLETVWQFIPFRQNENQINQVKELADKWGVKLIFSISNRFDGPDDPMLPFDSKLHTYNLT